MMWIRSKYSRGCSCWSLPLGESWQVSVKPTQCFNLTKVLKICILKSFFSKQQHPQNVFSRNQRGPAQLCIYENLKEGYFLQQDTGCKKMITSILYFKKHKNDVYEKHVVTGWWNVCKLVSRAKSRTVSCVEELTGTHNQKDHARGRQTLWLAGMKRN